MPIEIDEFSASVTVAPNSTAGRAAASSGRAGATASAASARGQDADALLNLLRPLVRRLLQEELEMTLRARGIR